MATMSVSEARSKMREAIERVKEGEEIHLTQNGEVVAVWLHPSKVSLRVRTPAVIKAEALLEQLRRDRQNPPEPGVGIGPERAEQWIHELREERDYDAWERAKEHEER